MESELSGIFRVKLVTKNIARGSPGTQFMHMRVKERSNMGVTPNFWVTISLYKKECLPVITRNKKHSSKQVVSMIYTLGKDFFATATF